MSSPGDFQKQLSKILTSAKAQGYKPEEVLPDDMQYHSQVMKGLETARAYIKEVEGREKTAQTDSLTKRAKSIDIGDQSEEIEALKVDLQQAQHQIRYYKELAEHATERAERYQRKMAESLEQRNVDKDATKKIERLQAELRAQQAANLKLAKENKKAAELAQKQQKQDQETIQKQSEQLEALNLRVGEVEAESDEMSEAFTNLVDTLESENQSVTAAVNSKSNLLQQTDKIYSAIVSEVTPLSRFFHNIFHILGIYQFVFQTLSDPSSNSIMSLPDSLNLLMDSAADDLYIYNNIHRALQSGGVVEEKVRLQLDQLASNAGKIYNSLDSMKDDMDGFLRRLRSAPDAWMLMKGKFGVVSKLKRFSTG